MFLSSHYKLLITCCQSISSKAYTKKSSVIIVVVFLSKKQIAKVKGLFYQGVIELLDIKDNSRQRMMYNVICQKTGTKTQSVSQLCVQNTSFSLLGEMNTDVYVMVKKKLLKHGSTSPTRMRMVCCLPHGTRQKVKAEHEWELLKTKSFLYAQLVAQCQATVEINPRR